MKVLGRIFLNSRKEWRKDGKTERRKDGVFLWVVEELTFLIKFQIFRLRIETLKVLNKPYFNLNSYISAIKKEII